MDDPAGTARRGSLLCAPDELAAVRARSLELDAIDLGTGQLGLLELLLGGALHPLAGYLGEVDARSVRERARLADGTPWPIEAVLHVPPGTMPAPGVGAQVNLRHPEGMPLAILSVEDVFACTCAEPTIGAVHLGGRLEGLELPPRPTLGWLVARTPVGRPVVGLRTRRTLHRADIAFLADAIDRLEAHLHVEVIVSHDPRDWNDDVRRARACRAALDHVRPDRVSLALAPGAGGADGAREAFADAIVLRNGGCTHVVVDANALEASGAAGPGDGDVLRDPLGMIGELGIEPLPHGGSGNGVHGDDGLRELIAHGDPIPDGFTFPEVVAELERWFRPRREQGFTVFFTGLSGAGKSTIATRLMSRLVEIGSRPVTLLDGDVVRRLLSSGLGFSKADRDLNIARIAYVATEITRNGGIAICAPIAPYRQARDEARRSIGRVGGFLEVHVATSLEVSEQRDRKGLYARARRGELRGFTGIDDPYEPPDHPEVVIDTADVSPEQAVERIVGTLAALGYVEAPGRA